MANVRSLYDYAKKDEKGKPPVTSSFTGGEKSGLAVENPEDASAGMGYEAASAWPGVQRSSGPLPSDSKKVTVYKNGFVVDDGEFRSTEDPANQKFLKELESGFAPRELQPAGYSQQVHVALDDKRSEVYTAPSKPKYELFAGEGYTMGASGNSSNAGAVNMQKDSTLKIDEDQPTTTLQIRFHDGQRRSQRFNVTHTIGDVHMYLMEIAPVDGEYKLLAGFPPKEVTVDPSTTLKDAGLLQAALTQKLC